MNAHLAGTPVLQTDRLVLRAPGPQDWPAALAFFGSDRSEFVRGRRTLTRGEIWRAFCHVAGMWVMRGWGSFVFARKGDDTALGIAGPWFPEGWPEPEIGWSVWNAEAEGKGYAFEAAQAARDHAIRALGWTTAVSYVHPENARSIRLAERLGATRDANAPLPEGDGWAGTLVFRHPTPARTTA